MRAKVLTILIVLGLLTALCTAEQIGVKTITGEALEQARDIIALVREGRLETAQQQAQTLDKAWDKRASLLELVVDHKSTDDVRFAFSRLIAALDGNDREAALIYAAELEGGIEHVAERQAFLPENIL